ncbi:MAG: hypothetical protein K2X47_11985 [Bdellovibrionales bacterium]|nr:hypothetical protein [Bdellovibrionales bacterium]
MKLVAVLFVCLAFVGNSALASQGCAMFPPNKLRFPVRNDGKHMTRPQFRKILDASEAVYQPVFKALGMQFYIEDMWYNDDVNACASIGVPCSKGLRRPNVGGRANGSPIPVFRTVIPKRDDPAMNLRFVEIYGGLGRHPDMTPEALMLVICHEIGHHLAGYPRYDQNTDPMATEGQSDYFATAKCARSIYEQMSPKTHQNWAWANKNRIPKEVLKPCTTNFPPASENAIYCARSSIAGYSLATTLASLGAPTTALSFTQKDPTVVTETFESHPQAQCRLDTYVAGALCQVSHEIPFSVSSPIEGACLDPRQGATRPKCWYKEPNLRRRI